MSMLAELVEHVIGVDTHAETHTAAVVTAATGAVLETVTVSADPQGHQQVLALAQRRGGLRAFALEGAGGYGAGLARHLAAAGETLFGQGTRGAVRGSALALPSMMCSCCAAPVAVGLRQRAADVTSTMAYWLANPALNPVVLAFCAFVLPWPWTVLRAGAGLVVVVGSVVLAR